MSPPRSSQSSAGVWPPHVTREQSQYLRQRSKARSGLFEDSVLYRDWGGGDHKLHLLHESAIRPGPAKLLTDCGPISADLRSAFRNILHSVDGHPDDVASQTMYISVEVLGWHLEKYTGDDVLKKEFEDVLTRARVRMGAGEGSGSTGSVRSDQSLATIT